MLLPLINPSFLAVLYLLRMPLCGIHPYVFELNQASMNATKQHIIMTEAIYNSLKAQGLVLSENTSVTLPHVRIPKPTFIDRVATILGASNKFRD